MLERTSISYTKSLTQEVVRGKDVIVPDLADESDGMFLLVLV